MNHFFELTKIIIDFGIFDIVYNILFCYFKILIFIGLWCFACSLQKWIRLSSLDKETLARILLLWWITTSVNVFIQFVSTFTSQKLVWLSCKFAHFFTDCDQWVDFDITCALIMFVCELIFVRMASSQGLSISGSTTNAILQSGGNISSQVCVTCCTELS